MTNEPDFVSIYNAAIINFRGWLFVEPPPKYRRRRLRMLARRMKQTKTWKPAGYPNCPPFRDVIL